MAKEQSSVLFPLDAEGGGEVGWRRLFGSLILFAICMTMLFVLWERCVYGSGAGSGFCSLETVLFLLQTRETQ